MSRRLAGRTGRNSRGVALLLALALWLAGCRKTVSQDHVKAAQLFDTLRYARGDEAVLDPRMAQVEALLKQVSDESLSYASAQALQKRIQEDRARLAQEKAAQQAAVQEALKPPAVTFSPSVRMPVPVAASPMDPPDAGSPQPITGMPLAELSQRFSGCFSPDAPVNVLGKGKLETWTLKDIANCRDRHPGFDGRLILIEGGQVLTAVDRAAARAKSIPDGGAPKAR